MLWFAASNMRLLLLIGFDAVKISMWWFFSRCEFDRCGFKASRFEHAPTDFTRLHDKRMLLVNHVASTLAEQQCFVVGERGLVASWSSNFDWSTGLPCLHHLYMLVGELSGT